MQFGALTANLLYVAFYLIELIPLCKGPPNDVQPRRFPGGKPHRRPSYVAHPADARLGDAVSDRGLYPRFRHGCHGMVDKRLMKSSRPFQ